MLIKQNTFKAGKLFFGTKGSNQRDNIYAYRIDVFNEVLLLDYPEYYLLLQGDIRSTTNYLHRMSYKTSFKYMSKLAWGLDYSYMESIGSEEFETIIERFKRFLKHHITIKEELHDSFNIVKSKEYF